MLPIEKLNLPGEHSFSFVGKEGILEAIITVPADPTDHYLAVLGHPHSLQGGTMTNKVVTTLSRAFKEMRIRSIRFNFRGVGASEGTYNAGIGESEDMLALMELCKTVYPQADFLLAGFSFGSYVAYRAAAVTNPVLLITVAPPVNHFKFEPITETSWYILQGDLDEVVPFQEVQNFAERSHPPIPIKLFKNTGHFFHGKLLELKEIIIQIVQEKT